MHILLDCTGFSDATRVSCWQSLRSPFSVELNKLLSASDRVLRFKFFLLLQVMGVVRQLQSSGQGLEMNVIIDKLMAQSR